MTKEKEMNQNQAITDSEVTSESKITVITEQEYLRLALSELNAKLDEIIKLAKQ